MMRHRTELPLVHVAALAPMKETGETVLVSAGEDETIWVAPTRHDSSAAFNDIAAIVGEARRKSEKQGRPVRTGGIGMLGDFVRPSLIKENA